jgi:hypothetical protein
MSLSYNPSTQVATITDENSAEESYYPYSSSNSWCLSSYNYCPQYSYMISTLNHNSDGTWTYTRNQGITKTFTFSSTGALESISDTNGDQITVTPENPGVGMCPSTAYTCNLYQSIVGGSSTPTASIVLIYEDISNTVILTQSSSYAAGNLIKSLYYCYYGLSCSTYCSQCNTGSGSGKTGELQSVNYPNGSYVSYDYDSSNSNASLQNDLLIISGPLPQEQVTNTYNSLGQVIEQQINQGNGELPVIYQMSYNNISSSFNYTILTTQQNTGQSTETYYLFDNGVLIYEINGYNSNSPQVIYNSIDPKTLLPFVSETSNSSATYNYYESLQSGTSPLSADDSTMTIDAMGNAFESQYNSFNEI